MSRKTEELENEFKVVTTKAIPSLEARKGRADAGKRKRNMIEDDYVSSTQNEIDYID